MDHKECSLRRAWKHQCYKYIHFKLRAFCCTRQSGAWHIYSHSYHLWLWNKVDIWKLMLLHKSLYQHFWGNKRSGHSELKLSFLFVLDAPWLADLVEDNDSLSCRLATSYLPASFRMCVPFPWNLCQSVLVLMIVLAVSIAWNSLIALGLSNCP